MRYTGNQPGLLLCMYTCIFARVGSFFYCITCLLASDCLMSSDSLTCHGSNVLAERGQNRFNFLDCDVTEERRTAQGFQRASHTEVKHTCRHLPDAFLRPSLWINKRHRRGSPTTHRSDYRFVWALATKESWTSWSNILFGFLQICWWEVELLFLCLYVYYGVAAGQEIIQCACIYTSI